MVITKIRGYRLLYLDLLSSHLFPFSFKCLCFPLRWCVGFFFHSLSYSYPLQMCCWDDGIRNYINWSAVNGSSYFLLLICY
ncbi:hypothetical protein FKM82_027107 [Ascaphus truei]